MKNADEKAYLLLIKNDIKKELDELADGRSFAFMMRRVIQEFLEKHRKKEKK